MVRGPDRSIDLQIARQPEDVAVRELEGTPFASAISPDRLPPTLAEFDAACATAEEPQA
jgi:hypothetical protein